MILTTHAIVGGALASLFPSHPIIAVAAGFASHFAIDAIPHWDYSLRSIMVAPGRRNQLKLGRLLLQDVGLIGFDACAGLALAISFFSTPAPFPLLAFRVPSALCPHPL